MIVSFGDKATEDIFDGLDTKSSRKVAQNLWARVQAKLDMLNAGSNLEDLRVPPANRLEKLRGDWSGYYSVRVNDRYRLVFRFAEGNAYEVQCVDYH